jgi:hypothetical protein
MVLGIVICMTKRESANIHSVPTTSNPMASVSNTAIKRKKCSNNGCTNNAVRNGICISHGAKKRYCTILGCGKPLYQARKCRSHFCCLLLAKAEYDSTREEVSAATKAMVGKRRDASATTSGSVVGGQKFHSIDHDASILDITDLTLELIQQYVGMNNWENVLAFGSVCKSWKDATNQYPLKIGVELMEGGDGRKLNVSGFLNYLDQEKFQLAETVYVPCGKADMLFYCDVKAKCPRMKLLIHRQWLMMNGNTEFVVGVRAIIHAIACINMTAHILMG